MADQQVVATAITAGPLDVDDFIGSTLDIEHFADGPLTVDMFLGDAFDHLPAIQSLADAVTPSERTANNGYIGKSPGLTNASRGSGVVRSARAQTLVSVALSLLDELGDRETMLALLDVISLDHPTFYEQHAARLVEKNEPGEAIEIQSTFSDESVNLFTTAYHAVRIAEPAFLQRRRASCRVYRRIANPASRTAFRGWNIRLR